MASSAADSTLLAIVVLAYRPDFLDQTLASLAAQAPGAYRIYLFDDAGPEAVHEAVQRWSDRMALRYHRFPENLGQYDLAGHWARCIRATQGEPWVWLFSDDDVMRPGSVEALLRKAGEGGLDEGCVYRIPMEMIDAEGHTVTGSGAWPPHLDAAGYLRQRLGFRLLSSVNEFIFSRASFDAYGFPSF
ncbi:MAG TPA: glycosyltransferase, partial [Bacteroidales bacterium]|nr:glycosyltransferase [Bacteroidales bacterium]